VYLPGFSSFSFHSLLEHPLWSFRPLVHTIVSFDESVDGV